MFGSEDLESRRGCEGGCVCTGGGLRSQSVGDGEERKGILSGGLGEEQPPSDSGNLNRDGFGLVSPQSKLDVSDANPYGVTAEGGALLDDFAIGEQPHVEKTLTNDFVGAHVFDDGFLSCIEMVDIGHRNPILK